MSSTELTVSTRPEGAIYDLVPAPHVAITTAALRMLLSDPSALHPTISKLPDQAQRQRLNERKHQLHSLLQPASNSGAAVERIGKAVGNMLGGWLNNRGLNVQEVISGWTAKLQELPAWAVILACEDFKEGKATFEEDGKVQRLSPEYAPSQATVWKVARAKISDLVAERDLILKIMDARLAAPELGEVEVGRVAESMAALANRMGMKVAAERKVDAERARREIAESDARRAKFKADANARRLARYAELGLRPVYRGDTLCDADALPNDYRVSVHEPIPQHLENLLVSR